MKPASAEQYAPPKSPPKAGFAPLIRMAGSIGYFRHAFLAQSVEQLTLNQRVVGSSPTGGTACLLATAASFCGGLPQSLLSLLGLSLRRLSLLGISLLRLSLLGRSLLGRSLNGLSRNTKRPLATLFALLGSQRCERPVIRRPADGTVLSVPRLGTCDTLSFERLGPVRW